MEEQKLANAGPFIMLLVELDAELAMGITITRDDILQREFLGLQILREEREKVRALRAHYQEAVAARGSTAMQPFD